MTPSARRRTRFVAAFLALAVTFGTATVQASEIVVSTDGPVAGELGSVSSVHELATRAGLEILERGGNAVDAMVATVLAVCVVRQSANGLAGYGGAMVIYRRDLEAPVVVDFNTRAPLAATTDMFYETREGDDPGILSISTWNTVAGLAVALEDYGTLSWAEVLEPAIRYADEGFILSASYARAIDRAYQRMCLGRAHTGGDLVVYLPTEPGSVHERDLSAGDLPRDAVGLPERMGPNDRKSTGARCVDLRSRTRLHRRAREHEERPGGVAEGARRGHRRSETATRGRAFVLAGGAWSVDALRGRGEGELGSLRRLGPCRLPGANRHPEGLSELEGKLPE